MSRASQPYRHRQSTRLPGWLAALATLLLAAACTPAPGGITPGSPTAAAEVEPVTPAQAEECAYVAQGTVVVPITGNFTSSDMVRAHGEVPDWVARRGGNAYVVVAEGRVDNGSEYAMEVVAYRCLALSGPEPGITDPNTPAVPD